MRLIIAVASMTDPHFMAFF